MVVEESDDAIRRSVRGVGKRDDEHAMEHFAAARDMLRFESDRLSNIFSAFLLANTVFIGFLLHAATSSGGFPGEPGTAVAGGLVGLCVSGLWLAADERNGPRSRCAWRGPVRRNRMAGSS